MVCGTCGAKIAEKAIVCYRCGTATSKPQVTKAAPAAVRPSVVSVLCAIAALVVAGLANAGVPDASWRTTEWSTAVLLGLAAVALFLRQLSRR